ncbi:hypothetical protein [Aliagarivorans taiwanensis]|uniref:hypothetical protein n=1 Tax=Aliagarivorans taiwanensis TaxID=561966 RepID=UPI00042A3A89|nr:hypothetical protein [Aliagarivorans taiwanensis]
MAYKCEIIEHSVSGGKPSRFEPVSTSQQPEILAETSSHQLIISDDSFYLQRLDGQVVWQRSLYFTQDLMSEFSYRRAWRKPHERPKENEARPFKVWISDDRLLVATRSRYYDSAWGTTGPMFILDMKDGSIIAEMMGQSAAALSGGRFITGRSGYDWYDSRLFNRDGEVVCEWPSYGDYIVTDNDDIRVQEERHNSGDTAHLVRLLPNGEMERGVALNQQRQSAPLVLPDGACVFFDSGVLRIVDKALNEQLSKPLLAPNEELGSTHWHRLERKGQYIEASIDYSQGDSASRVVRTWLLAITNEISPVHSL